MPERPVPREPFIYLRNIYVDGDEPALHFRHPMAGLVINAIHPPQEGDLYHVSFCIHGTDDEIVIHRFDNKKSMQRHIDTVIDGWLSSYWAREYGDEDHENEIAIPPANSFGIQELPDGTFRVESDDPDLQEIADWMTEALHVMTVQELFDQYWEE